MLFTHGNETHVHTTTDACLCGNNCVFNTWNTLCIITWIWSVLGHVHVQYIYTWTVSLIKPGSYILFVCIITALYMYLSHSRIPASVILLQGLEDFSIQLHTYIVWGDKSEWVHRAVWSPWNMGRERGKKKISLCTCTCIYVDVYNVCIYMY